MKHLTEVLGFQDCGGSGTSLSHTLRLELRDTHHGLNLLQARQARIPVTRAALPTTLCSLGTWDGDPSN